MKKLSWIVMGLLFLSGIGMIAWSLFPMPVELISGKSAGEKPEKTAVAARKVSMGAQSCRVRLGPKPSSLAKKWKRPLVTSAGRTLTARIGSRTKSRMPSVMSRRIKSVLPIRFFSTAAAKEMPQKNR